MCLSPWKLCLRRICLVLLLPWVELADENEGWAFVFTCQKLKTRCLILQALAQDDAVRRESHRPSPVPGEHLLKEKQAATRVKNADSSTEVGVERAAFCDMQCSDSTETVRSALLSN